MPSRRQFLLFLPPTVLAGCATIPPDTSRRPGGVADASNRASVWQPPDAAAIPARQAGPSASPEGDRYVCPMHPEVNEPKPGACPKCAMPLELRKSGGAR